MKVSTDRLELINTGNNSSIYIYREEGSQAGLALKVVPASAQKESAHLLNEYTFLSLLGH